MKKDNYESPKIECIELEIEDAILAASGKGTVDDANVLPEW